MQPFSGRFSLLVVGRFGVTGMTLYLMAAGFHLLLGKFSLLRS
jgi:hypothetical protein